MAKRKLEVKTGSNSKVVSKNLAKAIMAITMNPKSQFYVSSAKGAEETFMHQFNKRLNMHPQNTLAQQVRGAIKRDKNFLQIVIKPSADGKNIIDVMWNKGYRTFIKDSNKRGRTDRGEMAKFSQMPPWVDSARHGPSTALGAKEGLNIVNWPDQENDNWGRPMPYKSAPWESYHWLTEDAFNIVEWGTRMFKKDKGDSRFVTKGRYFVGIKLHTKGWASGELFTRRRVESMAAENTRASGEAATSGKKTTSFEDINLAQSSTRGDEKKSDVYEEVDSQNGSGTITREYLENLGDPVFVRGVPPLNIFTNADGNPHMEDLQMISKVLIDVISKQFASSLEKKSGGKK